MRLKKTAALSDFLQQVQTCQGEVWFVTDEGDRLNLKSMLSEFLFLTAAISSSLIEKGQLELEHAEDALLLEMYLEE